MSTFIAILVFIAVGALIGFLGSRLFPQTSLLIDVLLGLAGSFGISFVAKLLKLGAGFLSFSWLGLLFGLLGACLFVGVYGIISRNRRATA